MVKSDEYDIVRPNATNLFESSRSFGYAIETAIADLIDNSIAAKATSIIITYGIDNYTSFVRIEDNGSGMSEEGLRNAMRVGSVNPLEPRNDDDLGRFGLGLKTSSFSQCRRLTVKSKDKSKVSYIRCWDLDIIADKKDWILLKNCVDAGSEGHLSVFNSESDTGTIVLWEKLDRLIESDELANNKEHFFRKFDNVKKHLGLIFHRFIEEDDISIVVQGDIVKPFNPFVVSEDIPSAELPEESLSINGEIIIIQPYILPHESKLTSDERKYLHIIKGWTEHQGIYLYRNKRLISDGTWLDLDFRKKENQRLCRIKVDIPNTLDKEWQIDVRKASAKIPDFLRKTIKTIFRDAIDKSIRVYTHRGAYVRRKGETKEIVYLWNAKQKNGVKTYLINDKHPLYALLYQYLGSNSVLFKNYISLLAEAIPINLIVNDFSDPQTIIETPLQHQSGAVEDMYHAALQVLINQGVSTEAAARMLNTMDVFQKMNTKL